MGSPITRTALTSDLCWRRLLPGGLSPASRVRWVLPAPDNAGVGANELHPWSCEPGQTAEGLWLPVVVEVLALGRGLGYKIATSTVWKILNDAGIDPRAQSA